MKVPFQGFKGVVFHRSLLGAASFVPFHDRPLTTKIEQRSTAKKSHTVTMTTDHVISKMAAGSNVARGGIPELKNRKLKEKAVAFYAQHNVPATIEKLLNGMFLAAPPDVYGYMVRP